MARIAVIIIGAAIVLGTVGYIFFNIPLGRVSYSNLESKSAEVSSLNNIPQESQLKKIATTSPTPEVTHLLTPYAVRGIYFTSWAAGSASFRKSMFDLLSSTTLNSIVIDVKDYSGRVSFPVEDKQILALGAVQNRIPDIKELIKRLHKMGIYVIARVAVFQDPYLVKVKPEWAVHDKRTGGLWRDSGGAYWLDPSSKDVWKYVVAIARESYNIGFDEINFDYIRFPSDGAVSSAVYSKSASTTKASVIRDFFSYLHQELSGDLFSTSSIPISADLFGQTTTDLGDMGIGQYFENSLPYFDAVAPMVYPSHYINGFAGYDKPATHPYEIVKYALDTALNRSIAKNALSDIRPWLQAFDLGAVYTPTMVRDQIRATYDAGLNSWILWNAGSVYQKEAILTPVQKTKKVN